MIHTFLLWLLASLASCAPATTPTSGPPTGTYHQHPGRSVTDHRPAEVGPVVTIPGPACPEGERMPEDQSGCLPDSYWTTTTVCTEDMDCWDCSTMGNLICGPTTTTNG